MTDLSKNYTGTLQEVLWLIEDYEAIDDEADKKAIVDELNEIYKVTQSFIND